MSPKQAHIISIAILCMMLPLPSLACSPVNALPIFFESNSSSISTDQIRKLAQWIDHLKTKYPNRDSISTEVRVETGEKNRIQLGWQRELTVRLALINLDFNAPSFYPTQRIIVEPPQPSFMGEGIPSRSVWIQFIPDCPHHCPCQVHVGSRKD